MGRILLTGCNGQLGRAIQREYADANTDIVCTDVAGGTGITPLDITKVENVLALVRSTRPDVIINCAAHTNVDQCEEQWDLAYQINALGPRNLSIAASEINARLVHISTDYVFKGDGTRPYTEFDAVGPISAYGKTKLEGERFVQAFARKYYILRTAWLYGDGKNFVKTMLHLSEHHDEINVVCDQLGSPTSASELARTIHYLEGTENYGLFHATCEGDTNWADFAEEIFRLAGRTVKVNHVTSEEYKNMNPASANRPAYSILENYMLRLTSDFRMEDWRDAIKKYLTDDE